MVDVKLTFAANGELPPVAPAFSGKQAAQGRDIGDLRETDNAAILAELARVKAVFQLRTICAAMGSGEGN